MSCAARSRGFPGSFRHCLARREVFKHELGEAAAIVRKEAIEYDKNGRHSSRSDQETRRKQMKN